MFLYFLFFLSYFFLTPNYFCRNFPFFISLEHVDYSICTLEFESRRESYFWVLEALDLYRPKVPTSLFVINFFSFFFSPLFMAILWFYYTFFLSVCLPSYLSLFLSSFLFFLPLSLNHFLFHSFILTSFFRFMKCLDWTSHTPFFQKENYWRDRKSVV